MLIAKTPAIGSFLSKNPKATTTNERQLVTLKASPPLLYTFFQLLLYSLERRDFPERSHVPCLQLLSCWILSCYFTDGFILQIQSSLGSDDCEKTLWKNQQHNGPICQLPIHPHHCPSQCWWRLRWWWPCRRPLWPWPWPQNQQGTVYSIIFSLVFVSCWIAGLYQLVVDDDTGRVIYSLC